MREKEIVTVLFFSACYMTATIEGCEDLLCYVDYISTVTCTYAGKESFDTTSYTLSARWSFEGREEHCDLSQSDRKHEYIGSIDMEDFSVDTECTISISAPGNENDSFNETCETFKIGDKFKPAAPINLTVSLSKDINISWKTEYDLDIFRNDELAYELSYKEDAETWLRQRPVQIYENEKSLVLLLSLFQAEEMYVARIRARPKDTSIYSGHWSSWSTPVSWRTPSDENSWKNWMISVTVLVPAVIVTIILIIFKQQKCSLWKNVWVLIPDPEPFFKPLYDDHHGSFKSWLGYPAFDGSLIFAEAYSQGILKSESCLDLSNIERQKLLLATSCSSKDSQQRKKSDFAKDVPDKTSESTAMDTQLCSQSTTNGHEATLFESSDDDYPSVSLDSDNSSVMESIPAYEKYSEVTNSVHLNLPQQESSLLSNINILELVSTPPEEWQFQDSPNQDDDDENEFYIDNYNALSPDSGTSDEFGYPRICLDLDTIDSGFCDSECGSPVDFENNGMQSKSNSYSGEEDIYERNYVKQWVPSHSVLAESSMKN